MAFRNQEAIPEQRYGRRWLRVNDEDDAYRQGKHWNTDISGVLRPSKPTLWQLTGAVDEIIDVLWYFNAVPMTETTFER